MVSIDVSIDPGTNATGYCIWKHHKVIDIGTIRPRDNRFVDKAIEIHWKLTDKIWEHLKDGELKVRRFAVEDFHFKHAFKESKMSRVAEKSGMMKCAAIQGICVAVGLRYVNIPMLVSKGTISKKHTAMLAKSMGLKGSQDALDAFQVGVCAGFDKS